VVEALGGLPPAKLHCSVLAEEAIKAAIQDYYERSNISYDKDNFPNCESCPGCGRE
jgi:nitrogen fixation NifU-like protein